MSGAIALIMKLIGGVAIAAKSAGRWAVRNSDSIVKGVEAAGSIASTVGLGIMANEAANRGDVGRALNYAGQSTRSLSAANTVARKAKSSYKGSSNRKSNPYKQKAKKEFQNVKRKVKVHAAKATFKQGLADIRNKIEAAQAAHDLTRVKALKRQYANMKKRWNM